MADQPPHVTTPGSQAPTRIQRLPQDVINRIAAGEVVVRPSAALKELLENSLDAHATTITVSAREGGLKLLQVTDNGGGISPEDLPLLCERFATSKISSFEDLRSVATFGFRGEALASISHVARLSVLTKTSKSPIAYRAAYLDGALRNPPSSTAGVDGTSITIEDLFYNLPTRRTAFKSPSDEYRAIVDVVARYAIRYPHVAFICRKMPTASSRAVAPPPDVRTNAGVKPIDNIRAAFGAVVTNETMTLDVSIASANAIVSAIASTANFSMRKAIFIFFINGRLVDCNPLKRALILAYSPFIPKNKHPFVYIDLKMPQEDIDVNVHPMKKEVRFLNETSIIDALIDNLTEKLKCAETSRTFLAQSILVPQRSNTPPPTVAQDHRRSFSVVIPSGSQQNDQPAGARRQTPRGDLEPIDSNDVDRDIKHREGGTVAKEEVISPNDDDSSALGCLCCNKKALVCTCGGFAGPEKLEERPKKSKLATAVAMGMSQPSKNTPKEQNVYDKDKVRTDLRNPVGLLDRFVSNVSDPSAAAGLLSRRRRRSDAIPLLTSVERLLESCRSNGHKALIQILKEHTFVGVVSRDFALIQYSKQLMLADTNALVTQLMYQQALTRFADHDIFEVRPGVPVRRVIQSYLDCLQTSTRESVYDAESCATVLVDKGSMMEEYFGIVVKGECADSACVEQLPLLLRGIIPDLRFVGKFLYDLVVDTNWTEEQTCFHDIATTLSLWYGKHWDVFPSSTKADGHLVEAPAKATSDGVKLGANYSPNNWDSENREWTLRHVLFAAMRCDFFPPKKFYTENVIREITSTAKLYKIFERC